MDARRWSVGEESVLIILTLLIECLTPCQESPHLKLFSHAKN